jgi:hypothetical protein
LNRLPLLSADLVDGGVEKGENRLTFGVIWMFRSEILLAVLACSMQDLWVLVSEIDYLLDDHGCLLGSA